MALKPYRTPGFDDMSYFMNETGEAGSVVVFVTSVSGLGEAMDDADARVQLPNATNGSGEYPAGILMGDVVNRDLTYTHLNQHKRESQVGGKVGVRRHGEVLTNRIAVGVAPQAGLAAYFTAEGVLTNTSTNSTRIGTWKSSKDSDGYAKLEVNLV